MSEGAPKTINKILFFLVLAVSLTLLPVHFVHSQSILDLEREVEEKNKQIDEKKGTLGEIEKKIAEIRGSNNSLAEKISLMSAELDKVQEGIKKAEEESESKLREIEQKQKDLEEKKEFIDEISHELYVETRNSTPAFFLLGEGWDKFMRGFFIKTSAISSLRHEIEEISGDFLSLADARAELEKEKEDLDIQKKDLDSSFALLDEERAKLQAELKKQNAQKGALTMQIGGLTKEISQLQQFLLSVRSGGTAVNTSHIANVGADVASTADYFRNNAPAGSFAVFSFGAYTWRKGLSQYGADVRAGMGQDYQTILRAYYKNAEIDTATMAKIKVRHCGRAQGESCKVCHTPNNIVEYDFEDFYMKKIAEMPENFNFEAMKAQAVSARSYAIATTNYGVNTIEDDECSQAFNPSVNKPNWEAAVSATRNQVLKSGGAVLVTQYAAVHGGYSLETGWDSIDKTDNIAQMYEPKSTRAGSYWFYRQWFRSGYAASGADCGHSAPYLSNAEMADILNGYLRLKSVSSDARVTAIDINKCYGKADNPYSHQELRNVVPNPVTEVYNVITSNSNGTTTKVSFYTNRGLVEMKGSEFKTIFGLRAPAYFRIPQNGSIVNFNIEMKK